MRYVMICRHCGSINIISRGANINRQQSRWKFQCKECSRYTSAPPVPSLGARILLLDIETSLMEAYIFSPRTKYVTSDKIKRDWSILCWNAKWLFGTEMMGKSVTPEEAEAREDKRILHPLWNLMDKAHIIIHQNGKKFDIPKINWRFLMAGYPEPSYYQHVDTKEVLKNKFGASYNSQDWVTKQLGLPQKSEMHIEDWIGCLVGTHHSRRVALKKMFDYNRDDVVGLEEMYLALRGWIPSHANLGLYTHIDKNVCPNCQSTNLMWDGEYATPLGLYDAFRCRNCFAIGRSTKKKYRIKGVDVRG